MGCPHLVAALVDIDVQVEVGVPEALDLRGVLYDFPRLVSDQAAGAALQVKLVTLDSVGGEVLVVEKVLYSGAQGSGGLGIPNLGKAGVVLVLDHHPVLAHVEAPAGGKGGGEVRRT